MLGRSLREAYELQETVLRALTTALLPTILRVQPQTAFWRIARFGEGTSADLHDKSLTPFTQAW